ncbi:SDR family NAD(P)-dependent oxidoreductase [Cryptosporangium arvum]|uniref:SDR family NAD(P)-dependent oxidoreductase n=1 Tax=Cryptosporangium arvum TaxID=80871 RepID=UPI00055ACFD7|nr:SDR family oxidoreductase [Cryptosporangium arvum]
MTRPVAVVTGGARGLGEAIATRLAADGYAVVIADVLADLAAETAGTIEHAIGIGIDVTDDAGVAEAVRTVHAELGRIDVLVNNAGVVVRSASQDIDTAAWIRELDVNMGGTMRCSRAVYPHLLASPNPSIVNLASVGSSLGLNLRLGYTATKTGIVGMTRELAAEWGRRGIRVNAVAPGYMDTTMTRTGLAAGVLDEQLLLQHTPLGRLGRAAEVAAAVSFLVSPDASFVTGVVLPVDGGFVIDGTFHRLDE